MRTPLRKRPYWHRLLERVDELLAQGRNSSEVIGAISEEFDLPRQSVQIAVRRGDVPSIPSRDPVRAKARARGETTFLGNPCVKCGSRTRYVADLRCVDCDHTYLRSQKSGDTSDD